MGTSASKPVNCIYVDKLPGKLICRICYYLDVKDIYLNICLLNKNFSYVLNSEQYINKSTLCCIHNGNDVKKILYTTKLNIKASIRTLNWSIMYDMYDVSSVKSMSFTSIHMSTQLILKLPPFLERLEIIDCPFETESLPTLPLTLKYLKMSNNGIKVVQSLPPKLEFFSFSSNNLTIAPTLPQYITDLECNDVERVFFWNLKYSPCLKSLNCGRNGLSTLYITPQNLIDLNCSYNQLPTLPSLGKTLKYLNCSVNILKSLPIEMPLTLEFFDCSDNKIQYLPESLKNLNSLNHFRCKNNALVNLGNLPINIKNLVCSGNKLTSIEQLPPSLTTLDCSNNKLKEISNFPIYLLSINCSSNLITTLNDLPSYLLEFYCQNNKLEILPKLPSGIQKLNISYNYFKSIPNLPVFLEVLDCSNNEELIDIPQLPQMLQKFNCSATHLKNLPLLPRTLEEINSEKTNLDIQSIVVGARQISKSFSVRAR